MKQIKRRSRSSSSEYVVTKKVDGRAALKKLETSRMIESQRNLQVRTEF